MSQEISSSPVADAPRELTSRRSRRLPYARRLQNFLLVWLDANVDEVKSPDCIDTISKLKEIVNDINTFNNTDECVHFISNTKSEKVFIICSESLGQATVPIVHDMIQVSAMYIFCATKEPHEHWTRRWSKIKGVFTDSISICEALKKAAKDCDQNTISMSFIAPPIDDDSNQNLDQLDQSFMYTLILKEIILTIDFEQHCIDEYIAYCRDLVAGDYHVLTSIAKFEREYRTHTPIWWYTNEYFLYSMLNRVLRTMEVDLIIKMGFFVKDLHEQIATLHQEQYTGRGHLDPFIVYRGQGLTQTDFDRLVKVKGGLLSFNNFLSTSLHRNVSCAFAEGNQFVPEMVGVLFKITIDSLILSTPFANIQHISHFHDEEEILFSMHSIFRIENIQKIEENDRFYEVTLSLTSDDDPQLHVLTEQIRKETFLDKDGWYRLGQLLIKLSHFDKAQKVYEVLLDQTSDGRQKAHIYHQLGFAKANQGEYANAITFHEKSSEILQELIPENSTDLATCWNNIGSVYDSMGEYLKALSYYEKALDIQEKTLAPSHTDLGASYNNVGFVYQEMSEYAKALSFYEKALEIWQKTLPSNHPLLAISYNNIGGLYSSMGEYSKALSSYEKALDIRQKTLPPYHPSLAVSYNNIGSLYYMTAEHSKALSYFEKDFEIRKKILSPNHSDLAIPYNNIGLVYCSMGEYLKSLSYLEKALGIHENTLSSSHPDLGTSYNNVGLAYQKMGEYSKALTYHEKALHIRQIALPLHHPDLATSYDKIGETYDSMVEYSKALLFHEKALEIRQKAFPLDHPVLANSYDNIGGMYERLGEYSKAFLSYEKALEIRQKTLPPDHLVLAASYDNIGDVYGSTGEYSKALSSYEKALYIRQKTLPPNHSSFAGSYSNIAFAYDSMAEYSKALSCYEKVLEIDRETLPPDHRSWGIFYGNMGKTLNKMGKYSEALANHEKALGIFQETLPENHPHFAASNSYIGEVYDNMGDYSKALPFHENAVEIGHRSLPDNHPHLQAWRTNLESVKTKL